MPRSSDQRPGANYSDSVKTLLDLGPVLILPGLYDSGPEHWQTRWMMGRPGFRRVEQDDWVSPRIEDWVARGALLVAPSDVEAPSYPAGPTGFAPMPLSKLPFPSTVVASSDDPYVSLDRARYFAEQWGRRFVDIGNAGHINSTSGLGDWPEGFELLRELARRAVR